MKIGFTGAQEGMSQRQRMTLRFLLLMVESTAITSHEFHHGDCVGADAEAHDIVKEDYQGFWIIIHPPSDPKKRAWKKDGFLWQEKPYLERNRDIADECDLLIAAPEAMAEELRSGTWSTVRYARKVSRPTVILDR